MRGLKGKNVLVTGGASGIENGTTFDWSATLPERSSGEGRTHQSYGTEFDHIPVSGT